MTPRVREAIDYLAREFSVTRNEFRQHFHAAGGAEMLLDAVLSLGYAVERGGRIQLSDSGQNAQRAALERA